MNTEQVFSSAEILLPGDVSPEKWAVIACDQFTSDPGYWESCEQIVGGSQSSYDFILPEAYLGTPKETDKREKIDRAMRSISEYKTRSIDGFVALERTLPDGKIRRGLVGKLDLERYDYSPHSKSLIRATEKTVEARIPPRVKIRSEATVELPHILVFTRPDCRFINAAFSAVKGDKPEYDFDLMLGGGHLRGYPITGIKKTSLEKEIEEYERENKNIIYAVGDGNHSLAAAKAFYEDLKSKIGDAARTHPARYALCEMVDINDSSIIFEPIYRIMTGCDVGDVFDKLSSICRDCGEQSFTVVADGKKHDMAFASPDQALTVGTIQYFIDGYIKNNPSVKCDYIHGKNELISLAAEDGNVGFIFDGVDKTDLFRYVEENGTYPRKTFSMGEARSKRYYYEMRRLDQ